jgi:hypothetical protein
MTELAYRPPQLPSSVLERVTTTDFGMRFQTCVEIATQVWRLGWEACRSDWERGNWIMLYADWLRGELDQPERAQQVAS